MANLGLRVWTQPFIWRVASTKADIEGYFAVRKEENLRLVVPQNVLSSGGSEKSPLGKAENMQSTAWEMTDEEKGQECKFHKKEGDTE